MNRIWLAVALTAATFSTGALAQTAQEQQACMNDAFRVCSATIPDRNRTIADGLRSQPSELTFAHLQRVLDDLITVSENEIRAGVRELAHRAHMVAEPSGAVALAAYRQGTPSGRTVVVLSGGNIEPPMLQEILAG